MFTWLESVLLLVFLSVFFRYGMSSDIVNQTKCPICLEDLNCSTDVVQVRQKGAEGINRASLERGDGLCVYTGDRVHAKCRQRYINQKDIKI